MPSAELSPTLLSRSIMGMYSRPSPRQAAADAIPLLVDDTYHLFHLTTPPDTIHHPPRLRSSWSRMTSKDLVNWSRDPKPVITPGTQDSEPDASGAWTGSAVLGLDGKMNIFYTGYSLPQDGKQVVLRMVASDRHGTSFSTARSPLQVTGGGIGLSRFEDIDFRDPFIFFNESEREYWMLVATRLKDGPYWTRGCIALLTSPDLNEWAVNPEPLYAPGDMFCPECPELFLLPNGKWYLVYSRFAAPNSGTVYRVADSPYGPFRTPRDGSHGRLDGRRWYAAKSCPKAGDPTKRIYFGWIADKCEQDGKWLWGGDLGLPREVSANADGFLRIEPAAAVTRALDTTTAANSSVQPSLLNTTLKLSSVGSTEMMFPNLPKSDDGSDGHLLLSLAVKHIDAASFGCAWNVDSELKCYRLKFIQTGPTWSAVLLENEIPLDNFWADQYSLYIPRSVDGPEIVRHDGLEISETTTIVIALRGPLLECFVGGRSISYRLPLPKDSTSNGVSNGHGRDKNGSPAAAQSHRLGLFVEDGEVEFDLSISAGGIM